VSRGGERLFGLGGLLGSAVGWSGLFDVGGGGSLVKGRVCGMSGAVVVAGRGLFFVRVVGVVWGVGSAAYGAWGVGGWWGSGSVL